jgi:hypothetical protein
MVLKLDEILLVYPLRKFDPEKDKFYTRKELMEKYNLASYHFWKKCKANFLLVGFSRKDHKVRAYQIKDEKLTVVNTNVK